MESFWAFASCMFGILTALLLHKHTVRGDTFVLAEALCAAGLLTVMLLCQDSIFAAMTTTTLLLLIHLITLVSSVAFYRVSPFHPLAGYPGPLIHKVTKLRMMFLLQSGRHHEEIRRLHLQYGRFVRTGPSTLSINSHEATKPIYAAPSAMAKAYNYQYPGRVAGQGMFFMLDHTTHTQRRKIWAPAFTSTALEKYQPILEQRTRQLVHHALDRASTDGGVLDFGRLLTQWAYDIMGDVTFGNASELELMATDDPEGYVWSGIRGSCAVAVFGEVPGLFNILWHLPSALHGLENIAAEMITSRAVMQTGFADLASYLLDNATGERSALMSEADIRHDSLIAVSAGSETTATILIFIVYFVCSDSTVYRRLQAELDNAIPDASRDLDDSILKTLPYLNAVIEESLRLGAPFPGPRRVTPPEGAIVAGQALPGGINVSVPVWTQHLDPENFRPVPEEFRPERWLPEGLGPDTYTCTAALMAWSYGAYGCLGMGLAKRELRIVTTRVFRMFDIAFAPNFDKTEFLRRIKNQRTTFFEYPLTAMISLRESDTVPLSYKTGRSVVTYD